MLRNLHVIAIAAVPAQNFDLIGAKHILTRTIHAHILFSPSVRFLMALCPRQERKEGGGGAWHCFDDNAVEPWDVASLEKDCYGGRFTAEVWDAKSSQHVPHVRASIQPITIPLTLTPF